MTVRQENSLLLRQALPQPALPMPGRVRQLRRRLTSVVAALVWIVGGGAVIIYGAALVYANVARVEIDSAIVAGAVEPLQAPIAGRLQAAGLKPGLEFGAGERLFTVLNPDLEERVGLASIRVDRARNEWRLKISERDAERARRDNFLLSTKAAIDRLEAEAAAARALFATAETRFQSAKELFTKGFVTRLRLEDVADRLAETRANVARTASAVEEKKAIYTSVATGRAEGGVEGLGRLADTEAAVRRAEAEVALAADELRVLLERRMEAKNITTTPGRILRVLKLDGASVQPGDPIAIVERTGDRKVFAFLTQVEVGRVAIGDEADVVLPAQKLRARAKVTAVERSGAYLDDVESRYVWRLARDPGVRHSDRDRTARVQLTFASADQDVANRDVPPGTPAFVSFERSWETSQIAEAYTRLADLATKVNPAHAISAGASASARGTVLK